MKKNFTLLMLLAVTLAFSQQNTTFSAEDQQTVIGCFGNIQYPATNYTPSCNGNWDAITTQCHAGQYAAINVMPNTHYIFASSVDTDYISIYKDGDFFAAGTTPVTWDSGPMSGLIRYYIHKDAGCGTDNIDRTRYIKCMDSAPCTPPSNFLASDITSESAKVSWTTTGDGPTNGYQILASITNSNPSGSDTPMETTNPFLLLSNLAPDYDYYYWVRSNCGTYWSEWVYGGSFHTNPDLNCNGAVFGLYPPATLGVACGSGNFPTVITNVHVGEYSNIQTESNRSYTFSSSDNEDFITITNEAGTVIYEYGQSPVIWNSGSGQEIVRFFMHKPFCNADFIERTKSVNCTDLDACPEPTSATSAATDEGSAYLFFGSNITPSVGYDYYLSTTNTPPSTATVPTDTVPPGNVPYLIDLLPGTTYYYWVRSNCGTAKSAWLQGNSFTTSGDCTAPTSLSVNTITSASAILHWNVGGSTAPMYDIYLTTSNVAPTADTSPTESINGIQVLEPVLTPSTVYYYWVRSNCGTPKSDWISGGSFTTLAPGTCTIGTSSGNAVYTPSCTGNAETVNVCFAGEATGINVLPNTTYTFSSSVATDYITITSADWTIKYGSGNSPFVWSSGAVSGEVQYFIHTNSSCGFQSVNRTRYIKCGTITPTCDAPSNVTTANITSNSAGVFWTLMTSNTYDFYCSTSNVAPAPSTMPTGTFINVFTTGKGVITGLNSSTTYYYWLRTKCSDSSKSEWISGGSFTTVLALSCNGTGINNIYNLYPATTFTPACSGASENITTAAYAGEYSNVNILPGREYTFTSSVATDYITITNAAGDVAFVSGTTPLVWLSGTNSGIVRFFNHTNSACGTELVSRTRAVKCAVPCSTSVPTASAQIFCGSATVSNLTATGTSIKWYSAPSGGSTLAATTALATGIYYATQTISCESPRLAVSVTVNPFVTPIFTAVASICSGSALSALPTTSSNGITGTWSPALNNTATTDYTFTPNSGQCASAATLTITVNPIVTPTFTAVAPICSGSALSALPTTSNNGITGIWSPALNNTASTTYTFTPNLGQCSLDVNLDIVVNQIPDNSTVLNGVIITANQLGATYQWFNCDTSQEMIPEQTGQNFTAVANGNYAVEITLGDCTVMSECVTINSLGNEDFISKTITIYPNPSSGLFTIDTGNIIADSVIITDNMGRMIFEFKSSSDKTVVDMNQFSDGIYYVKVKYKGNEVHKKLILKKG